MKSSTLSHINNKLTKAEIVENIYSTIIDHGISTNKRVVQAIADQMMDEIKQGLVNGRAVELRGFGTFELRLRKGREKARNPRTGAVLPVESHSVAVFRPGRDLKEAVWSKTP
jgi:nucleoid DNA-binding protein